MARGKRRMSSPLRRGSRPCGTRVTKTDQEPYCEFILSECEQKIHDILSECEHKSCAVIEHSVGCSQFATASKLGYQLSIGDTMPF
jgi:hypothetical protein